MLASIKHPTGTCVCRLSTHDWAVSRIRFLSLLPRSGCRTTTGERHGTASISRESVREGLKLGHRRSLSESEDLKETDWATQVTPLSKK